MAFQLGMAGKIAGLLVSIGATAVGVACLDMNENDLTEEENVKEVPLEIEKVEDSKIKVEVNFEEKVKNAIKDTGIIIDWCEKRNGENKYFCGNMANQYRISTVKFSNKYIKNTNFKLYMLDWKSTSDIEVEISEEKETSIFPGGLKLVIVKNNGQIQIRKTAQDGHGVMVLPINSSGEFKFKENKLEWAWQEINDLTKKVGLYCEEKNGFPCSPIGNTKINVRDGNMVSEGVTMDSGTLTFSRNKPNFFQGYSFVPKGDIQLKDSNGQNIVDKSKVTKLERGKSYQIERYENKWYLTKK